METLCDGCSYMEYKGIVVWGREPTEAEKKFNEGLKRDGKEYWCSENERYFNKSFQKRKHHCQIIDEEIREEEIERFENRSLRR